MRVWLSVLVSVVIAAVAAFSLAQDSDSTAAQTIDWKTDLTAARALAAESGRPLLVAFR